MDSFEPIIDLRGRWQTAALNVPAASAEVGAALDRALAALVEAGEVDQRRLVIAADTVCAAAVGRIDEVELLRRLLHQAIDEYAAGAAGAAGGQGPGSGAGPGPAEAGHLRAILTRQSRPVAIRAGVPAVAIVAVAIVVLLARVHGGGGTSSTPPVSPTPAATVLRGHFTRTTMTCPPAAKEIPGDACLITLTLPAGRTHVVVTWAGPALMAMGIRDHAGVDLGPQTTGEKGTDGFDTPAITAGAYELRVVNVTHPATPFDFTVTATTPTH